MENAKNVCFLVQKHKEYVELFTSWKSWVSSIIGVLMLENQGEMLVDVQMEGWFVFASVFGIYSRLCTIVDKQLVGWFGICLTDK